VFNAALLVVTYLLASNALAFFGVGLVVTLGLWFVVQQVAKRLAATAPSEAPKTPETPAAPSSASAVQLLAILQRKGRLIDFLQEDLHAYSDAQIGAAVRSVHEGCKNALDEHIALEPIMDEAEGDPVTIERGFDANAIRLTGTVMGNPPFKGAVQHRGWRVQRVDLPVRIGTTDDASIVAPAEIEVQ